jgi:hypothetical protein
MPRPPEVFEDLKRLALGLVVLIERTERMLRFRVRGPGIHPAYAAFDLLFHDPGSFVGDVEMDDVRLRFGAPPSGTEPDADQYLYAEAVIRRPDRESPTRKRRCGGAWS